ncbi:hypothetical protein B6E66_14400 [Streptomyces maremycinicus]|nr:hypothetical protein B6E66_14400 [Streptomyces sp. B9173]
MTVGEQISPVRAGLPAGGTGSPAEAAARADPAGAPSLPPPPPQDETASLRDLAARLRTAYPSVDAAVVETTLRTAYEAFGQARIRAYVPILVERRCRNALRAACRATSLAGRAAAGTAAAPGAHRPVPGPEKDRS